MIDLKSLTILYVEDEPVIRKEITQVLELLCKEVYPCESAQKAYAVYESNKPDMVLSDISLGGDTGIDLTKKIRKEDKYTPIILLSAHTDTEYLLEAAKLKLVAYLTKPINFEELQQTLLDAANEIQSNNLNEEKSDIFNLSKNVQFDLKHKLLLIDNKQKKLSHYESTLLAYFITNSDRTISTDEIKNNIWDDPYDATDSALKSLMYKLRTKIGKEFIQNLSGVGYYLNIKN